ncbi:hypothetical protein P280DRAFT_243748 [Massarina eburnea CBS 473.64]|uniref:Secreted protein n=1 Tax=Massarina eburnea CBS 473.64 TaxID=1395130 RepID=A0A6A6S5T2_9PLEO|nr:hypothetical protein P280DRAFT_243748 [Massarina eburnea CBS 473.64]
MAKTWLSHRLLGHLLSTFFLYAVHRCSGDDMSFIPSSFLPSISLFKTILYSDICSYSDICAYTPVRNHDSLTKQTTKTAPHITTSKDINISNFFWYFLTYLNEQRKVKHQYIATRRSDTPGHRQGKDRNKAAAENDATRAIATTRATLIEKKKQETTQNMICAARTSQQQSRALQRE